MKHITFVDRKAYINSAVSFLISDDEKFICYRSEPGYGITAFFHRLCFLLQSTQSTVCLYSELSDNNRSPLHDICRNLTIHNSVLCQNLQMYADEYYGEYTQPLINSVAQDIPILGNTLSYLLDSPKALPIYSGFYSDVLKQLFFELIKNELVNKTVLLFIDNVQNIDNDSLYDVLALAELKNVKVIMSQTGRSDLLEKLLLEIQIKSNLRYIDFVEPTVECVQELWESYQRNISQNNAQRLIQQSHGDIRKIVYSAIYGYLPMLNNLSDLAKEILALIRIFQSSIKYSEIVVMLDDSPTYSFVDATIIRQTINDLVQKGFLLRILRFDGEESFRARIASDNKEFWDTFKLNDADKLIYQDIVYRFLCSKETYTIYELTNLYTLSNFVAPHRKAHWSRELLIESLKLGYPICYEWIDSAKSLSDLRTQFFCALCLYKKWKYNDALAVMSSVWPQIQNNRNAKILYSLILNRCRQHKKAESIIWDLISTSSDVNEKAILLSMAVSNSIHDGNEEKARKIVEDYSASIYSSSHYGYFLRNSATLYQDEIAEEKWADALILFRQSNDNYGELTTLANMARVYIRKGDTNYARSCLEQAYNGLMSYGMEQLHIVSNNLAIACYSCGDTQSAKKYIRIAKVIAKSIMPKTYITINECYIMIKDSPIKQALAKILDLKTEVDASNLHRLKGRYYLALSGLYCLQGDFLAANDALIHAEIYTKSFSGLRKNIRKNCVEKKYPSINEYKYYYAPAYLEYWIANPLSILSQNILTSEAFA